MGQGEKFNRFPFLSSLLTAIIIVPALLMFSSCGNESTTNNEKVIIAFKNASIIDALHGQRNNHNVLVSGNKIIKSGPANEIVIPKGAEIIDCKGKFLIPGLWDAHAHLTNEDASMPGLFPLLIANGIIYIRDTGAILESILSLREKANEELDEKGLAPRIFITGPHLDGLKLSWSSSVSAGTPEDARNIVDSLLNAGVNELKVYDLIPREVALEVFSIAREKHLPMCAHVPLYMDVIEASDSGLKSMEHMYNLEMSCSSDWDSLLTARRRMMDEGKDKPGQVLRQEIYRSQRLHSFQTQDEQRRSHVLATLKKNETWQVPTLVIIAQDEHRMYARNDWKETFRFLPAEIKENWMNDAISKEQQTPSEEELAHAAWAYDMVKRVKAEGIGIMAGTDMPLSLLTPGFSLHEELALLVRAGLSPLEAIEAATLAPAKYYGIETQQGSVSDNMLADLILLDANPLDDIRNTMQINAVMVNGHLHTRKKLDIILQELENTLEKKADSQ